MLKLELESGQQIVVKSYLLVVSQRVAPEMVMIIMVQIMMLMIGMYLQMSWTTILTLGGQKTICSVDIAWYRGNLRVNNFVISASSDGTSFTNVFTGKSSGTTLSAETYSLPTTVTARFVRVTVNGNTENNWASITELSVVGFSNTLPPSHPTADNKTISTNAGTPVTITLTGNDPISGDILKFSVVGLPQHG